jgi:hypothetical protein
MFSALTHTFWPSSGLHSAGYGWYRRTAADYEIHRSNNLDPFKALLGSIWIHEAEGTYGKLAIFKVAMLSMPKLRNL